MLFDCLLIKLFEQLKFVIGGNKIALLTECIFLHYTISNEMQSAVQCRKKWAIKLFEPLCKEVCCALEKLAPKFEDFSKLFPFHTMELLRMSRRKCSFWISNPNKIQVMTFTVHQVAPAPLYE